MDWFGLTLVLFGILLVFLFLGIPVAFSMGITASLMVVMFLR